MAQFELAAYRKAVVSFKRTVELDENWASGYVGLGKAYLQIKYRRLDARNALRMAARLAPDDPEIQYQLGMAHMNVRTGRPVLLPEGSGIGSRPSRCIVPGRPLLRTARIARTARVRQGDGGLHLAVQG